MMLDAMNVKERTWATIRSEHRPTVKPAPATAKAGPVTSVAPPAPDVAPVVASAEATVDKVKMIGEAMARLSAADAEAVIVGALPALDHEALLRISAAINAAITNNLVVEQKAA